MIVLWRGFDAEGFGTFCEQSVNVPWLRVLVYQQLGAWRCSQVMKSLVDGQLCIS